MASPSPGNSTVEGATVAGMKNLRIRFRASVGDHIDRSRIALIGQVPAIDEDGESVGPSKSRTETKQRITIRKERVRLVNWITRKITLQIWTRIETGRALVKQLRFIKMNRDAREAIVAVNSVLIEMKIVERVALIE